MERSNAGIILGLLLVVVCALAGAAIYRRQQVVEQVERKKEITEDGDIQKLAARLLDAYPELGDMAGVVAEEVVYQSKTGVPRGVILGVIGVESKFDPEKRGKDGDIGLMQVRPTAAIEVGYYTKKEWKQHRETLESDLSYAPVNIRVGVKYLNLLHEQFNEPVGEYHLSIIAYNAGPSAVKAALAGRKPISLSYYSKVQKAAQAWQ